jgi:aminoglycoside phosphotransferase (APT) family kinase protein
MALHNRIDTGQAATRVAKWLGTKYPAARDIAVHNLQVPNAAGMSNETVLFDVSWREDGISKTQGLVARVQPSGPGVFIEYDLRKEARVISALSDHTPVAVPKLLFYEEDPSTFGSPFLVMPRIDGQAPGDDPPFTVDGWVLELTPAQRRMMWLNSIDVLAQVHATDWQGIGLDFLDSPEHHAGVSGQLKLWRDTFEWATEGEPNPTMEAALDWLRDNMPVDQGPKVLCWGDSRPGNILYDGQLNVAGVLDWEMVCLANREYDLGWILFTTRHHTEGIGAPLPEGFLDRAATIDRYQEITGHQVKDIDYYEVFAGVRLAIIMVRAAHMLIAAGALPRDSTMAQNNHASQLVAKFIGLPAPSGAAVSYIGNR